MLFWKLGVVTIRDSSAALARSIVRTMKSKGYDGLGMWLH